MSSARPAAGARGDARALRGRSASVAAWQLLRATFREWWNDDVFQFAAALAFYTIFSMAPIVTVPWPDCSMTQLPSHSRSCGQIRPQISGKVLVEADIS